MLKLCQRSGMVKLGHVAIDGTKVKASASKHKAMSYARMKEDEARLKKEIAKLLRESEVADGAEDRLYGKDKRGDELPEELAHRESRLKKIQEAKAQLEAEARVAAREVEPAPKAQRNFTDPESRIMPVGGGKTFEQAYNAQAAVDHDSQVIVAETVLRASNDKGQLVPMVEWTCENLDETPLIFSADSGYWVEADLAVVDESEIEAVVAPGRIRHSEWREQERLTGAPPPDASRKERMWHHLRTEAGRAEYDKRKITVEPVFGQIKEARGFRRFSFRGHEKVGLEWTLVCTVHNLLKLCGHQRRMAAAGGA